MPGIEIRWETFFIRPSCSSPLSPLFPRTNIPPRTFPQNHPPIHQDPAIGTFAKYSQKDASKIFKKSTQNIEQYARWYNLGEMVLPLFILEVWSKHEPRVIKGIFHPSLLEQLSPLFSREQISPHGLFPRIIHLYTKVQILEILRKILYKRYERKDTITFLRNPPRILSNTQEEIIFIE